MRPPLPPVRGSLTLAFASGLLLAAVDGSSIVLTKIQVPDDVRAVAHVASAIADDQPATRLIALDAYEAAAADARKYGITVETEGFTIFPDGRVTLTGGKTAPTLLLNRIPQLAHLTDVTITVTVEPLPYS